jgi:hypothetical protein
MVLTKVVPLFLGIYFFYLCELLVSWLTEEHQLFYMYVKFFLICNVYFEILGVLLGMLLKSYN